MKFIDREEETRFLLQHFAGEPHELLFVYGPKSSGKSTLLMHVAKQLDLSKYSIAYMDLRGLNISNYNSFLDTFFDNELTEKSREIKSGITVNTGLFKMTREEKNVFDVNAFKVMEDKLLESQSSSVQPIIIIDEIQLLRDIKVNGESYLIDKLFNLFVRLTKVLHVAHVVLATSDSYFIEEIYNSAKLKKTSRAANSERRCLA